MLSLLKKLIKNDKGAMDRILVTLLFVVIGVASLIGTKTWYDSQKETVQDASNEKIQNVLNE